MDWPRGMKILWLIGAALLLIVALVTFQTGYRSTYQQEQSSRQPSPVPQTSSRPTPTPQPSSPLDEALKKFVKGNIAFNNPEQMRVGNTGEVQAVLSIDVPVNELMDSLTAAGKKESALLQVSDHMQATLTGGGAFDVTPAGPQSQWISTAGTTTWHWLVTPKLTGEQFLTLTMDAIITIDGQKDTRNVTTLTRQINIEVARPHNSDEWFAWIKERVEAIGWVWGIAVAVVGVMVGFWTRIKRWLRPGSNGDADPPG